MCTKGKFHICHEVGLTVSHSINYMPTYSAHYGKPQDFTRANRLAQPIAGLTSAALGRNVPGSDVREYLLPENPQRYQNNGKHA